MTDLKFRCDGLFKEAFSGLNNQLTRVALIHYFGNSHTSKDAVDILIYLIAATYSADEVLLEKWDGFIVRTYEQIELDTACKGLKFKKEDNNPLFVLENRELIERDNNSAYGSYRYRVNPDKISEEIERALEDFELRKEQISRKLEKKTENKIKFRESCKDPYLNKDIDWYRLGENAKRASVESEDGDAAWEMLKSQGFTQYDVQLIYFVDKFWREKYGEGFVFNYPEFKRLKNLLGNKNLRKTELRPDEDGYMREVSYLSRLKDCIDSLEDIDNLKKAWPSTKIEMRWFGQKNYKENK